MKIKGVTMSYIMWEVVVGGLHMELRESRSCHGKRYTLVFSMTSVPNAVSITYLGDNRNHATSLFARKVELHRNLVGPS